MYFAGGGVYDGVCRAVILAYSFKAEIRHLEGSDFVDHN